MLKSVDRTSAIVKELENYSMQRYYRVLRWPLLSLLITGALHFTAEAIWPDLKSTFIPPTLAPLLLLYGLWVGYRMVGAGGNYLQAIVAGAILGILPIVLDTVGSGVILGRGTQVGTLSAVFGFAMILFGSLIGSGFALSHEAPSVLEVVEPHSRSAA